MRDTNIVTFRLGPKKVYLVQGAQNTQPLLRMTSDIGSEAAAIFAYKRLFDMSPEDIAKFAADKSSRLKRASPGSVDNLPGGKRYWYGIRRLYDDYMMRPHYANSMADKYYELFSACLEEQPVGEWNTVSLFSYLKENMARSAIVSLCGQRILDLNPDFLKQFWAYDRVVFYLLRGAPKWLNHGPWKARDEFLDSISRALQAAWESFDWSGPAAHADWEESFGSRFSRECVRWARESGLSMRSTRGLMALMIFGYVQASSVYYLGCAYGVQTNSAINLQCQFQHNPHYDLGNVRTTPRPWPVSGGQGGTRHRLYYRSLDGGRYYQRTKARVTAVASFRPNRDHASAFIPEFTSRGEQPHRPRGLYHPKGFSGTSHHTDRPLRRGHMGVRGPPGIRVLGASTPSGC